MSDGAAFMTAGAALATGVGAARRGARGSRGREGLPAAGAARRLPRLLAGLLLAFCIALLAGCAPQAGGVTGGPGSAGSPAAASSQEEAGGDEGSSSQAAVSGTLVARFIDVGQGDSELVSLPDGKWMLIDAGDAEHGQTVVSYLQARGVAKIDYLVATHPHADHIGGMRAVLAAFDVGEVWMPDASEDTETFNGFLDAVQEEGCAVKRAVAGEDVVPASAGYEVAVLGPAAGTSSEDMNDYSVVLKIAFGSTSFLFTGDASADEIVADDPAHVDVLKAAHHGSDTGTDAAVMEALTPSYVVMSYAEGNSYGHPDQGVLDAIAAAGATAYGTGANGDVTATSDGASITMTTARAGAVVAGASAGEAGSGSDAASTPAGGSGVEAQGGQGAASADEVVYVTASGAKYHRKGCEYIEGRQVTALSREDAEAQGYEPCGRCF